MPLAPRPDARRFTIAKTEEETHDTRLFHLEGDVPGSLGEMPICSCIRLQAPDDVKLSRPYSPLSFEGDTLIIAIKEYKIGGMSQWLFTRKAGDSVDLLGPYPKIPYQPRQFKHIGFICGGTGITPCFQLLRAMRDAKDPTPVTVLYSNRTSQDIMLKSDLDELASECPGIRIIYVLTRSAPPGWPGPTSRIGQDLIQQYMPLPGQMGIIMVSGPDSMYESLCGPRAAGQQQDEFGGVLRDLGYSRDEIYKF